jgi:hypothetical protein
MKKFTFLAALLLSTSAFAQGSVGTGSVATPFSAPITRQLFPVSVAACKPADPTGNSTTGFLMMGLGTTCSFTPKYSTTIHIQCAGAVQVSTGGTSINYRGYTGTGTAPANGAAVTGTQFGPPSAAALVPAGSAQNQTIYLSDFVTVAVNTTYWADVAISSGTGAITGSLKNMQCEFEEM